MHTYLLTVLLNYWLSSVIRRCLLFCNRCICFTAWYRNSHPVNVDYLIHRVISVYYYCYITVVLIIYITNPYEICRKHGALYLTDHARISCGRWKCKNVRVERSRNISIQRQKTMKQSQRRQAVSLSRAVTSYFTSIGRKGKSGLLSPALRFYGKTCIHWTESCCWIWNQMWQF